VSWLPAISSRCSLRGLRSTGNVVDCDLSLARRRPLAEEPRQSQSNCDCVHISMARERGHPRDHLHRWRDWPAERWCAGLVSSASASPVLCGTIPRLASVAVRFLSTRDQPMDAGCENPRRSIAPTLHEGTTFTLSEELLGHWNLSATRPALGDATRSRSSCRGILRAFVALWRVGTSPTAAA